MKQVIERRGDLVSHTFKKALRHLRGVVPLVLIALCGARVYVADSAAQTEQGAKVVRAAAPASPNEALLKVSRDGAMSLKGELVTSGELQKKLQELAQRNPKAVVTIEADALTPWTKISKILNAANAAHLSVASAVETPSSRSSA